MPPRGRVSRVPEVSHFPAAAARRVRRAGREAAARRAESSGQLCRRDLARVRCHGSPHPAPGTRTAPPPPRTGISRNIRK